MANRVRQPLDVGRVPYQDPVTPGTNDTVDFATVFPAGVIMGDPSTPEDIGTEVISAQAPAALAAPTVTTGQATDHVYVNASWAAADDAEDVPPAAQYEVYVQVSGQNPVVQRVAAGITSIRIAPAKPSTTYNVKVRPISRLEVVGEWSSYGSVTSAAFVVPTVTFAPTTPGAPTVTAAVYSLLVLWTALSDVTAGYGHYDVQIATDSGFTANVRTRSIDGTITSFSDLTPGTTYYARVRGVAPDGTAGSWSSGSSAATTKIVAGDITANTITAAQIAADTITAAQLAADSVTADELAALNLAVGKYIRSTTYTAGSAGWSIDAAGNAEFNNVTVRGTVEASAMVGATGAELLPNGHFATTTTGWTAEANCTIARATSTPSPPGSETAFLKATCTGSGVLKVISDTGTSGVPVVGGDVYVISRYQYTDLVVDPVDFRVYPVWYDSGGSVIATSDPEVGQVYIFNDLLWKHTDLIAWQAPSNAAFMAVRLEVENAVSGGHYSFGAIEVYKASFIHGGLIEVPRLSTSDDFSQKRIEVVSPGLVKFYNKDTYESDPGFIEADNTVWNNVIGQGLLRLSSPRQGSGKKQAQLELRSESNDGSVKRCVYFTARPKNAWTIKDSGLLTPSGGPQVIAADNAWHSVGKNGGGNITLAFTKNHDDSVLVVDLQGTAYSPNTGWAAIFGVSVNGTDNACAMLFINVANQHLTWAGGCTITGLSAGTYNITLRFKSNGVAVANINLDSNDRWRIKAQEGWQD